MVRRAALVAALVTLVTSEGVELARELAPRAGPWGDWNLSRKQWQAKSALAH